MFKILKSKKKGFTLIELLVVVAIISLLSSVVMASLNSARVKARDVKRKADLQSLGNAIELYYISNNGTYPGDATTQSGDWDAAYKAQLAPYISAPPLDPSANNAGRYYGSYLMTWSPGGVCDGQYVLWAYIEGANPGANTCGFGGTHWFRVLGK